MSAMDIARNGIVGRRPGQSHACNRIDESHPTRTWDRERDRIQIQIQIQGEKKSPPLRTLLPILSLLMVCLFPASTWAFPGDGCKERPELRILPDTIGQPWQASQTPFVLPCDTMIVPQGHKTTILPGTLVHFRNPSPGNQIVVKGALMIDGEKDREVVFAGAAIQRENERATPSGDHSWSGIKVESTGTLQLRFANVVKATTALWLISEAWSLEELNTFGCRYLVLHSGQVVRLREIGDRLADFDLKQATAKRSQLTLAERRILAAQATAEPRNEKLGTTGPKPKAFFTTRRMVWLGGMTSALVGSGALYWWLATPRDPPSASDNLPVWEDQANPPFPQ